MSLKTLKEELKKALALFSADNQPALKVSDMVIGGKVEIPDAEGTLSDAPDGEYTVDKDVIEVKDGQITSINGNKEAAIPAEADTAMADAAPAIYGCEKWLLSCVCAANC